MNLESYDCQCVSCLVVQFTYGWKGEIAKWSLFFLAELSRLYPSAGLLWSNNSTTPFTCIDANIFLLHFNVPHVFTLNLQKLNTFKTSLHPLSNCWKLDRKFTGCWGHIKVHIEAALLHTPHFLRKTDCPSVYGKGSTGWLLLLLWLLVRRS